MQDNGHIVWNPKFSVGVEEIDAQHRELFAAVNTLIDMNAGGSGDLYPVLKKLADYLSAHFRAEQKLMVERGFPDLSRHMREHQLFTERVLDFLGRYKEQNQRLINDMLLFLRHWIHSHTTTMDMKYAEYIKG